MGGATAAAAFLATTLRDGGTCCARGPAPWLGAPPAPARLRAAPVGSARQRAKLWELNASLHCSVIGTCLTAGELRRLMGRFANSDVGHLSDHDLHAEAVGLCGQANPCSKLLTKALDQRHHVAVRQFARLADEAAVLERWREARGAGDIPGAYWAVLTHPAVGAAGIRQAFGDVHMLSHLLGSANRADIKRLAVLEAEKAALLDKVARQQARLCEAAGARDAAIGRLAALAADRPVPVQPAADDGCAELRQLAAALEARLAAEAGRRERLEARLQAVAQAGQAAERRAAAAERDRVALLSELAALEGAPGPGESGAAAGLPAECILYVGGRPGTVGQLRAALADAGGELLAHDGGLHDNPALLAALVGRADRVVFPVDCVSHDAALTVKRLCRQLGKPWSPLRSSGVASFLSALASPTLQPSRTVP